MLASVANELRTLLNDLLAPRHLIDGLNRIFHPYDFHGRHTSPLTDREIKDIIAAAFRWAYSHPFMRGLI